MKKGLFLLLCLIGLILTSCDEHQGILINEKKYDMCYCFAVLSDDTITVTLPISAKDEENHYYEPWKKVDYDKVNICGNGVEYRCLVQTWAKRMSTVNCEAFIERRTANGDIKILYSISLPGPYNFFDIFYSNPDSAVVQDAFDQRGHVLPKNQNSMTISLDK